MTHKIDHRQTFLDQFEALKKFPMFQQMATTVENSPWHRESNVLLHTQMVVDQYIKMTDEKCNHFCEPWTRNDYLGGIAAVFHDTGKPLAEIKKFSPERGEYHAYHGHELLSARLFETYAADRFPMFTGQEIAMVSFIIEHHMPWSIEDTEKRRNLALTANYYGGAELFCRHLLADQYGRLADDQSAKNKRAVEWVSEFLALASMVRMPPIGER